MASKKHLVLDDDVYEALKGRKELLGSQLGDLGNAILRERIEEVRVSDMVCKVLLDSGRISLEEYKKAVQDATIRLRDPSRPHAIPVEVLASGETVSGSWEIHSLCSSPTGSFQILEVWARDSLARPMGQHSHEADEYFIALTGTTIITMTRLPFTLTPGAVLRVPSMVVHTATPLTQECHMLAVTLPATKEYSAIRK